MGLIFVVWGFMFALVTVMWAIGWVLIGARALIRLF